MFIVVSRLLHCIVLYDEYYDNNEDEDDNKTIRDNGSNISTDYHMDHRSSSASVRTRYPSCIVRQIHIMDLDQIAIQDDPE